MKISGNKAIDFVKTHTKIETINWLLDNLHLLDETTLEDILNRLNEKLIDIVVKEKQPNTTYTIQAKKIYMELEIEVEGEWK